MVHRNGEDILTDPNQFEMIQNVLLLATGGVSESMIKVVLNQNQYLEQLPRFFLKHPKFCQLAKSLQLLLFQINSLMRKVSQGSVPE